MFENWVTVFHIFILTYNRKLQWRSQPNNSILLLLLQLYYHYSFLLKFIVFTVNEHGNICVAGLNHSASYPTGKLFNLFDTSLNLLTMIKKVRLINLQINLYTMNDMLLLDFVDKLGKLFA